MCTIIVVRSMYDCFCMDSRHSAFCVRLSRPYVEASWLVLTHFESNACHEQDKNIVWK